MANIFDEFNINRPTAKIMNPALPSASQVLFEKIAPENHPVLEKVLFCSPFIMDLWLKHPSWMVVFFEHLQAQEWQLACFEWQSGAKSLSEAEFMQHIREWRMQQMAIIAARELLNLDSTEKCCRAVSELANQAIIAAKLFATQQVLLLPRFQSVSAEQLPELITLGMGKLGGYELNYSSDIDLIFFYHETEQSSACKELEWPVFMTTLVQRMIKYIGANTEHGFVFRVDVRLRPFGDSGALALNLVAAENYYTIHGRNWERYALIKGRAVTGSEQAQAALETVLHPFVYRRYLDFGSLEAMRDLKARIISSYTESGLKGNIKLGRGGIREIEFVFQLLQLTYGGKEPALQTNSLVRAAHEVSAREWMDALDVEQLLDAYWFLRKAENALQMMRDQQVHALPKSVEDQQRLSLAVGYESYESFLGALQLHQAHVVRCFDAVLYENDNKVEAATQLARSLWLNIDKPEVLNQSRELLDDPEQAAFLVKQLQLLQQASALKRMSEAARLRLDDFMSALIPLLVELKEYPKEASVLWTRLQFFIKQVALRSAYLVMLTEKPSVLKSLLGLMAKSAWIADSVSSYPAMLDILLEPVEEDAFTQSALAESLEKMLRNEDGQEAQMESMRRFKQEAVMKIASADLNETLPIMQVSDALTFVSESLLDTAMKQAKSPLLDLYGEPQYQHSQEDNATYTADMFAIGYGKMGGLELGYDSDLDIVFLHDSFGVKEYTSGEKSIDNTTFFARWVQKTLHYLNTLMHNGRLYEIDMRLRPNGASGTLASRINGYQDYLLNEAWLWELQALVRARFVAGNPQLGQRFEAVRKEVICQPRNAKEVRREVLDMRLRMRKELGSKVARNKADAPCESIKQQKFTHFELKQDFGGIADIEFMVQYAVLANASEKSDLAGYTDNIRLLELLGGHGYFEKADAQALIAAYQLFRETIHHRSLQNGDKKIPSGELNAELMDAIDTVSDIWLKIMYT